MGGGGFLLAEVAMVTLMLDHLYFVQRTNVKRSINLRDEDKDKAINLLKNR